jgi:uncharacterized Ntn-hydrolase superfamily protein
MTFSITARDADTGELGIAAATGTAGVGQLLTWARTGVGAVATQGWINPYLGIDAIALLGVGHPAEKALQAVVGLDDDQHLRQLGVVDANGGTAAHTGSDCAGWCGHETGEGFVVAGNLLESSETVRACAQSFRESADTEDLVQRLILALEAGEKAGGDKRGVRSATVYVVSGEEYPLWDLRVDDHDAPIEELHRLRDRLAETLLPQIRKLPTRLDPRGSLSHSDEDGLA